MVTYLTQDLVRQIAKTVVEERLDHTMLVAGLHRGLPLQRRADFGSVWQDLNTLNGTGRLDDGSLPLQVYLETALFMLEQSGRAKAGAPVFTRALAELSGVAQLVDRVTAVAGDVALDHGRTDLPGGDPVAIMRSIGKPQCRRFCRRASAYCASIALTHTSLYPA